MDIDELDDPFSTPSKNLRNGRLSPKSETSRRNIESSPTKVLKKSKISTKNFSAYEHASPRVLLLMITEAIRRMSN